MKKIVSLINFKRQLLQVLLIAAIGGSGCKKFVEIGPPSTQLATSSVFTTSAAVTAAQFSIYTQMFTFNESWNMSQQCALLSDELINYSKTVNLVQYYTNTLSSLTNPGPWSNAYNYIYQANAIIQGLKTTGNIPVNIAAQHAAESEFVRAFWHFYLTNLYGDVPLVLTTDYTTNKTLPRTPQAQVYQQIIADLKDAESNLSTNYVDATDTTATKERTRPNKWAAAALLARVYLYSQKYDSAEMLTSQVIGSSGLYSLCTNLSSAGGVTNYVFQANSTEAIWQLATPVPTSFNTGDGQNWYLPTSPSVGSTNSATISTALQSSFEPKDKRLTQWIGVYPVSGSGSKYYYPHKYQAYSLAVSASTPAIEYVMILRLAEQYLIRAEARAQQGKIQDAVSDLNIIRARAGLAAYAGSLDQISVLAAILHERRVELFTEWGHRWFDLKRTATIDAVMGGASGASSAKNANWISIAQLFPIAQSELLNDPNLRQNAGY
jgi:hypothetical protein